MNVNRFFPVTLALFFSMLLGLSFMVAASAGDEATKPDLPKDKQTSLGLYVTSAEAYDKWRAAPDKVKVFDVRTLEEYLFVGHAPMAWNIPLFFQTHEWDADKGHFKMEPNPDFLAEVKKAASPDETILVMCRSGGRSAMAVNLMAENGYRNVYQITDGMEGDAVKDPLSVYNGKRLRNGWKNSGLPWTYKPDPERILLPEVPRPAAED